MFGFLVGLVRFTSKIFLGICTLVTQPRWFVTFVRPERGDLNLRSPKMRHEHIHSYDTKYLAVIAAAAVAND